MSVMAPRAPIHGLCVLAAWGARVATRTARGGGVAGLQHPAPHTPHFTPQTCVSWTVGLLPDLRHLSLINLATDIQGVPCSQTTVWPQVLTVTDGALHKPQGPKRNSSYWRQRPSSTSRAPLVQGDQHDQAAQGRQEGVGSCAMDRPVGTGPSLGQVSRPLGLTFRICKKGKCCRECQIGEDGCKASRT